MKAGIENILNTVAGLKGKPNGAHNIRINGKSISRSSTDTVEIRSKSDNSGIDIIVKPDTVNEYIHIPVAIDNSGLNDMVYNDFFIGDNADVNIIAGCGIHNYGDYSTQHDGIHTFHIGENSRVTYSEKHYGKSEGNGENILNPVTVIEVGKGSHMAIESVQVEGVHSTKRVTKAVLSEDASLVVKEKILTSGSQTATTDFKIDLNGKKSSADIVSRSVAKGNSKQYFYSVINGNNLSTGHSACDAIIMDNAMVKAVPDVTANHVEATLIHEAAIGKIAGEQIVKLMTLGLTEEKAEEEIISGFLK